MFLLFAVRNKIRTAFLLVIGNNRMAPFFANEGE